MKNQATDIQQNTDQATHLTTLKVEQCSRIKDSATHYTLVISKHNSFDYRET